MFRKNPDAPVQVRYAMNQRNWEMVVEAGGTSCVVVREDTNEFVVEYPTRDEFEKETHRFDGLIEYHEVEIEE